MEFRNFFLWHYSGGLKNFFQIWKNYIDFYWNYFSIGRFSRTLFSAWKRDISRVSQRGLHPVLLLQSLIENVITRIVGAVVKGVMILVGMFFEAFTLVFGFFLLLVWLLAPVAFIVSLGEIIFALIGGFSLASVFWLVTFLASFFVSVVSILSKRGEKDYSSASLPVLAGEKWFERVWNRIGVSATPENTNALGDGEKLGELLRSLDLSRDEFIKVVNWEMTNRVEASRKRKFWLRENLMSHVPIGRNWAYAYTVHLDNYSKDLSSEDYSEYRDAKLVGMENELEELKNLLLRPSQNSVIIVGEPGVGRETIVHTLAREIRSNELNEPLASKRILELDVKGILADYEPGGEGERILDLLFNEATLAGNIILLIKDMHECLDPDGKDISPIISRFLGYPAFQVIGTTSPSEFHSKIEKKSNVMKNCDKIIVDEMSQENTLQVMLYKIKDLEKGRVVFTYQALREIVKLSDRYVSGSPFPEKALDLLEEVLLYWNNSGGGNFITVEDVNKAVSVKMKVPLGDVESEESKKLLNLEKKLHERVIGQEFAIRQIAETMRRARIGMEESNKPIGSFLFLGPTGVGKTESSKALAETYFGGEDRMIRLDMSEYQMQESIDRLIGSQSTGKEGYLVSKVKETPYALLLLDEIEKAYPDILNLFLQVLDEGHLTDAFGKRISFRNLIIIATSNAGSEIIREDIENKLDPKEIQKQVMDYVIKQGIFHPEFINRFEGVVFFTSLSQEESYAVTELLLKKYAQKLKEEENIEVSFGEGVVEKVVSASYNPEFGARAIERYIQDEIGDKIVEKIISKEVEKGTNFVFEASEIK
jgi:ATP-dependent Clp protease ATP-binding subunit ClpC